MSSQGVESSLAGLFGALAGSEPACPSTYTDEDGTTWRCAGIVCPMFPGSHKAWAVDVRWTDDEADRED